MKSNKYKLAPGVAGVLCLFFFFIAQHGSYNGNMVILGIFLIVTTLMVVVGIIVRKHIKSKWVLPGAICMFLAFLIVFLNTYFQHNNINDKNVTGLLIPILLLGFMYIGFRIQLSKLEDEKKIKATKKKFTFYTIGIVAVEILMLYAVFILHR